MIIKNKLLISIIFIILAIPLKAQAFDPEYDMGVSTFSYIDDKMRYYPNIGMSFGANFVDNVRVSGDIEYMMTVASSIWSISASIIYKHTGFSIQPYVGCKVGGFANYTRLNSVTKAAINAGSINTETENISKLERVVPKFSNGGYEVEVYILGAGIIGASVSPVYNIDIFMNYEPTLWPDQNLKYSVIHKFLAGFRYKF